MMQLGKYQMIRRLGRGGMAEVYLARAAGPMGFEKTLVVKRIHPHLMEEQRFIEMFLLEARLAAQLNHANVVQVFDFGEENGSYFIAMEYIDGPSLYTLIKRAYAEGTPVEFPLCAKIISFACEGLAYAHELPDPATGKPLGLVHRDISPDNILLSRNGGVKVVDFGIAKVASQGHRTQTGIVKGKVAYMSPEHLQGQPLDPRADVFALGVVLYKLVTGQHPFEGESDVTLIQAILKDPMVEVSERRQDVPEELERIVKKALAKERDQRYRGCRDLQEDLERFLLKCGEPVGSVQIAELVRRFTPPNLARGSVMAAQPSPQASMMAPTVAAGSTEVRNPVMQASTSSLECSPAPEAPRVLAEIQRRLGRAAGLLLLVTLTGAGGYLALQRTQRIPEPKENGGKVEPVLLQPTPTATPALTRKPAELPEVSVVPMQEPPIEAKPLATAPAPQEEEPPTLASFQVVSKPGGMVSINGKRIGRSPVTVEVNPGKVNVAVAGDIDGERFDTSQTVIVKPGINPPVSLVPRKLKVTVRGRPRDLKVQSLDTHFLGGSPGPLEVYEGRHTLMLSDSAGKRYAAECQATPGDEICAFEVTVGTGSQ
jgi:serine/threonine-protein kinase